MPQASIEFISTNMNENSKTPKSSYVQRPPFSSIKRSENNKSISSWNFELLCIKDLTKEILEAEDEPINKLPLSDNEEVSDEFEFEIAKTEDADVKTIKINDSIDLGISYLNTPPTTKNDICEAALVSDKIFNSSAKVIEFPTEVPVVTITPSDSQEFVINNVTYRVLKQLGKGGSSIVYHCLDIKSNRESAVKVMNCNADINTNESYQNEVRLLKQLQKCNRIIKMYDYEYFENEKKFMVVLEKGDCDLSRILKNLTSGNKRVPIHWVAFYWMEMLYAVQEIHQNGIIHADLKPANFLQVECGLKLIDFGISLTMQNDATSIARNCPIGSFNYISPEALTNRSSGETDSPNYGKPKYKINYKSDVWSLGCILYQLVYGKTPFGYINHVWAKLSAIMDPDHKIEYPMYDWVPKKFVTTMTSCLQYNIKDRPSIDQLIKDFEDLYH